MDLIILCNPRLLFEMDQSQSLNAPPFFDGNNYAFWKVHMRAFLCAVNESVWDFIKMGWFRPEKPKAEWDKAVIALVNANSKTINAIFCDISTNEFHRISHVMTAQEAWKIFETTYEGTKKVKDTKLQNLTTRFEEVKMSEDKLLDSFMEDSMRL